MSRTPVLTGPSALTNAEMVAVVGEALGRPLRHREVPAEVFVERAGRALPPGMAEALVGRYWEYAGTEPPITDEVERILGRPARSFAEWVGDHLGGFGGPFTSPA